MQRRIPLLAVAVALTPAGVIAVGHADGSTSTQPAPAARPLRLVARPTGGGQVDNAPKGASLGDQFYESGTITDRAGHRLGRFALTTQLVAGTPTTEPSRARSSCTCVVVSSSPTAATPPSAASRWPWSAAPAATPARAGP